MGSRWDPRLSPTGSPRVTVGSERRGGGLHRPQFDLRFIRDQIIGML
jgi:hypothetical protein